MSITRRLSPVVRMLIAVLLIGLAGWYALVWALLHFVIGLTTENALAKAPAVVGGTVLAAALILVLVMFGLDFTLNSREREQ